MTYNQLGRTGINLCHNFDSEPVHVTISFTGHFCVTVTPQTYNHEVPGSKNDCTIGCYKVIHGFP